MPALVGLALAAALLLRLGLAAINWPAQTAVPHSSPAQTASHAAQVVDLVAVQSLQLFGTGKDLPAGAASSRAKLATTDLDLSLEGVVLASDPKDSRALIISNGQQRSYRSGDILPVGAGVSLALIERDHVLIKNNGIEQALWLYDKEHRHAPATAANPAAHALANAGKLRSGASGSFGTGSIQAEVLQQAAPQQIRKAAARLAEIIEIAPAAANGKLIGYRLSPGFRLKDFVQLGFKSNDIVTSINGIALSESSNLPELYSLMNKPGDVSFSLLRDGQPLALQMTLAP